MKPVMSDFSDTIAAVATGGAISAIGIIRISGSMAIPAADKVFRASSGIRLKDAENRRMYYGAIVAPASAEAAPGALIDLCMCAVSRGPGSYTGEDTVEFHCHGSPIVLAEALRALFAQGLRQALPGEFTKRAFLNGRMDLTQAEAVIDLIEAESPAAARNAALQLQGAIRLKLSPLYGALLDIMAHFHAYLDYPDEDIGEFDINAYLPALREAGAELKALLSTHGRGAVLRDGLPTAIIGRPNTGKSSLLNLLLGYPRAIITDIAGTTRDTVEEKAVFADIPLRLIDTAGIRDTGDALEMLGVGRSMEAIGRAGLVILVLDGSEPLRSEDRAILALLPPEAPKLAAVNKCDLASALGDDELAALGFPYCRISALTGDGLDRLEAAVRELLPEHASMPRGDVLTNARQAEAISRALAGVESAIEAIRGGITPDAVLTDVEAALLAIGEITGATVRDDVVTRIFSRFCVGK